MVGSFWLIIVALLLFASLILHQVSLLLLSLLFFLAGGVARLWNHYCLTRVEYQRHLSANRVFFGEEVQLELEIANRKPLPLPWIQITEELPAEVTLLKGKTSSPHKIARVLLSNLLTLSWYHKVKRRYRMQCLQRGYFAFGPTHIRSGDLFGFFTRDMDIPKEDYLMVYPRMVPLEKLGIPSKQPLGDIRTKSYIFQDPILTSGVRDYHFGDSLRQIHWKTTARRGLLQTKVFEPTTTIDMGLFLDVRTTEPPFWGSVPELLELVIIAAASIANHAMAAGYRVGLYVNQNKRSSDEPVRIPPSQHTDQLMHMLEALAQIHRSQSMPIERLVLNESRNLPWGSTLVVISAKPTDSLFSTLAGMRRAGRSVALISVGSSEPVIRKDGLNVYYIRDNAVLSDLETLHIEGQ
ncbi:MAG: DUF58 domain-containing protein [Chloroflexota bacterium]